MTSETGHHVRQDALVEHAVPLVARALLTTEDTEGLWAYLRERVESERHRIEDNTIRDALQPLQEQFSMRVVARVERRKRAPTAGRPVVAEVQLAGNQHFVLLTGYSLETGVMINDPWFGDSAVLGVRYADPAIVSIRTFTAGEPAGLRGDGRMSWVANAISAAPLAR